MRVAAGIAVQSTGPEGTNTLLAHGLLTIAGRVEAGGTNTLAFGDPPLPPVITGPVVPPTAPMLDPSLVACTAQAACGDGTRDAPEECDDGNADSCDGCSASCQAELCGNGRLDCDEQCDPPDLVRCSATCQVIPQADRQVPGRPRAARLSGRMGAGARRAPCSRPTACRKSTQGCTDGDPRCDADGGNDGRARSGPGSACAPDDPRRPAVRAGGDRHVKMQGAAAARPRRRTDAANASALRDCAERTRGHRARRARRCSIRERRIRRSDHCTAPFALVVPHGAAKARRRFNIGAEDVAGEGDDEQHPASSTASRTPRSAATASSGSARTATTATRRAATAARPRVATRRAATAASTATSSATPVCQPAAGDRLHRALHRAAARPPHSRRRRPAARLRPGVGARLDEAGWPRRPGRAEEPSGLRRWRSRAATSTRAGACRLQLFACVGGADARLGCPAAGIAGVDVLRPAVSDPGPLRDALVAALASSACRRAPGRCARAGSRSTSRRGRKGSCSSCATRWPAASRTATALKLRCLPAPSP